MTVDELATESVRNGVPGSDALAIRFLSVTPAIMLAAQHQSMSISEFVDLLQQQGFGGKRGCRKLVHRLERLGLLTIGPGVRGDRREKSIAPTPKARQQLRALITRLNYLLS